MTASGPSPSVRSLGYVVLGSDQVDAWKSYGTDVLGMAEGRSSPGSVRLRLDERPFRILIEDSVNEVRSVGWEVAHEEDLTGLCDHLTANGFECDVASRDFARARSVRGLVTTTDPSGVRLELFHGPVLEHDVFVSPAGVTGFVTGTNGLGHVVMSCPNLDETLSFYKAVLGFRESDFMILGDARLVFLHCNPRHHSLALFDGPRSSLAHFMIEARSIDDVGYALDRVEAATIRVKQGLGRHSNDRMFSFYAATPGPFDVEFGWGGLEIDEATWTTAEITKTSNWGHKRPARPQIK